MVLGRVGAGVAGAQQPGQLLLALVEEAVQRVEAEAALAVRPGALLLCVALEQLGVEVERDRRRQSRIASSSSSPSA